METHKFVRDMENEECITCGMPESYTLHIQTDCPCCGYPNCGHNHTSSISPRSGREKTKPPSPSQPTCPNAEEIAAKIVQAEGLDLNATEYSDLLGTINSVLKVLWPAGDGMAAFASTVEAQTREECAKAMCSCCRDNGAPQNVSGEWIHPFGGGTGTKCEAAAIRSLPQASAETKEQTKNNEQETKKTKEEISSSGKDETSEKNIQAKNNNQ